MSFYRLTYQVGSGHPQTDYCHDSDLDVRDSGVLHYTTTSGRAGTLSPGAEWALKELEGRPPTLEAHPEPVRADGGETA
ncbi:hypothetical protein [Haloarchaeobius sp. DYHT-AS-18]|uniref:hypothetical protein n=1 Tax=Haloarchaeobius sp. DYHT-AS-18 TaxID=3446117 RepID=UPI003EB9C00E